MYQEDLDFLPLEIVVDVSVDVKEFVLENAVANRAVAFILRGFHSIPLVGVGVVKPFQLAEEPPACCFV
jgi:hypothetical protein